MNAIMNSYDVEMLKIDAYLESSQRLLDINYKEAELKVLTEGGDSDDLMYLREEADANFAQRAIGAVKKIIDTIVEFFNDLIDKAKSMIMSAKVKLGLAKAEKEVKRNPLFARKKIAITDIKKSKDVCDEHESRLMKLFAKNKAGQNVDPDEVDALNESFIEKHARTIATTAVVTITVAAALALAKKFMPGLIDNMQNNKNGAVSKLGGIMGAIGTKATNIQNSVSTKIGKALSGIIRKKNSTDYNWLGRIINGIGKAIKAPGKVIKKVGEKRAAKKSEKRTGTSLLRSDDVYDDDEYNLGDDDETEVINASAYDFFDGDFFAESDDSWDSVMNSMDVPDADFDLFGAETECKENSAYDDLMSDLDALFA